MTNRILLILASIASFVLSLVFAFFMFIFGALGSDSGTPMATTVTLALLGVALLYPVLTIVAIVLAHKKKSFTWALAPLVLPILLLAYTFLPFRG
ncbi:MAG TPA: hypothetical protein VGB97_02595 [Candidatus Paceibacterota bacterium]|jgi:uncharacterized membrane protein YhaH (DUF805 family)